MKAPVALWKTFVRSKTFSHEVEFLEENDQDEEDGSGSGGDEGDQDDDGKEGIGEDEAIGDQVKVWVA